MMKLRVAVLAILLCSFNAFAVQDVSCWDGDCLKSGWTRTDPVSQTFTDYQCYRDGCNVSGWIAGGTQGVEHYTQCRPGGCFVSGWYTMDRQAQVMVSQTRCDGDCMTEGWTTYSPNGAVHIACLKHDCAKVGWTTVDPSGKGASAYCKQGGCFQVGWIESY
ncbi:MAG: hypothetical protein ACJ763_08685 [Bdellovibrionia bacterium]